MNAGQWLIRVYDPATRTAPFYVAEGVTHRQAPCAARFARFSEADAMRAKLGALARIERARG